MFELRVRLPYMHDDGGDFQELKAAMLQTIIDTGRLPYTVIRSRRPECESDYRIVEVDD